MCQSFDISAFIFRTTGMSRSTFFQSFKNFLCCSRLASAFPRAAYDRAKPRYAKGQKQRSDPALDSQ